MAKPILGHRAEATLRGDLVDRADARHRGGGQDMRRDRGQRGCARDGGGLKEIEEQKRLEDRLLPDDIDYLSLNLLRTEARQKLDAIRPRTLGQAGRISGVSPADIGGLIVYLSSREGK